MKRNALLAILMILAALPALAATLLPGQSVITHFSDNQPPGPGIPPLNPLATVVAVYDTRNSSTSPLFPNRWMLPGTSDARWNYQTMGEVFGIATDDASSPNIYVTSTGVYTGNQVTQLAPGTGRVFRINGSNGSVTNIATLANTGQGLGNIAYDAAHQQLFVTNFYNGKIHRLSTSGTPLSEFDPFGTFNPALSDAKGLVPLGERIFGIGVFQNRVYFGRWSRDLVAGVGPNTVWSIGLDSAGNFSGTAQLEITLSIFNGFNMPVADIEFSAAGNMLIAERGFSSNGPGLYTIPHSARVLEYIRTGTVWVPTVNAFPIGQYSTNTNAAGGVDYACPQGEDPARVIATGDALIQTLGERVYGFQILPATGATLANSHFVDSDGLVVNYDKTQIGDIDVYDTCGKDCFEYINVEIDCTTDGSGDFILKFRVKNLTNATAYNLFLAALPAGVTASPTYFPLGGLAAGQTSGVLQTRIHGASPGQTITFQLTINCCCTEAVTVTLPDCHCGQIVGDKNPVCTFSGAITYTFTLQNLYGAPISYIFLAPQPGASVSPNVIDIHTNPILYGGTRTFTVTVSSPTSRICLRISLHDAEFRECCSFTKCLSLPRCFPWIFIPDDGTTLQYNTDFTAVDIFDPNGEPGCSLPFGPDTHGVDLHWAVIDGAPVGASIVQELRGSVDDGADGVIASLRTEATATGSNLHTTFPGLNAVTYRYEFFREGQFLGEQEGVPADAQAITSGPRLPTMDAHFSELGSGFDCTGGPGPGCIFAGYTFNDQPSYARVLQSGQLTDEIRVFPEDVFADALRFTALHFKAHAIPRVTFTSAAVSRDCNGNGLDDFFDVAKGGSRDLDEDGIPDECSASSTADLDLSLNTGTTPWQIVNANPATDAQIVVQPTPVWRDAFPGSSWISLDAFRGDSRADLPVMQYEQCFCIGDGAETAQLDLLLRADDGASVYLNDAAIGGPGGNFRGTPLGIHVDGTVGANGPFRRGRNCVRVDVQDTGGVLTGLDLIGAVHATEGACP